MTIPVVEVAIVIESHINQLLPKLIEFSQKNSIQLSSKITQRWELDVEKTAYSNSNFSIEKVLDIIDKDTYNQKNNFFSARRSIHKKQDDYGRNISLIMIK